MKRTSIIILVFLSHSFLPAIAQKNPESTEIWSPEPKIIKPGSTDNSPPSDAIILFDGTRTDTWQHGNGQPIKWTNSGNILTVKGGSGSIQTKQKFGDCQLHIEWRTPAEVQGNGQQRGNSGVFLMGRYELQILDSYDNKTFSNGQAGSIYKQYVPLVNACKAPGEWQSFDIIFTAPRFSETGSLLEPARMTVMHNGVLIHNNAHLWGRVSNVGLPSYERHEPKEALLLQDHGNPISFRNIWIREL